MLRREVQFDISKPPHQQKTYPETVVINEQTIFNEQFLKYLDEHVPGMMAEELKAMVVSLVSAQLEVLY